MTDNADLLTIKSQRDNLASVNDALRDLLSKKSQRIEELEGALRSVKSTLNGIQEPEFSGYGCDRAIDEIDKALDKE